MMTIPIPSSIQRRLFMIESEKISTQSYRVQVLVRVSVDAIHSGEVCPEKCKKYSEMRFTICVSRFIRRLLPFPQLHPYQLIPDVKHRVPALSRPAIDVQFPW